MGNEIFGIDVAGIVADTMSDGLFPVTLVRDARAPRDPNNLTGGRAKKPETITGPIGFWEDFTGTPPPGVELELNDRKLVLLGDTIPLGKAPRVNDAATVLEDAGPVGPLYVVQLLSRDPAAAVYVYLCRDRRGPDGK